MGSLSRVSFPLPEDKKLARFKILANIMKSRGQLLEVKEWLALFHPSKHESARFVWQSPAGRQHRRRASSLTLGNFQKLPCHSPVPDFIFYDLAQ